MSKENVPLAPAERFPTKGALLVLMFAWIALVVVRCIGPSDIYDKEQPRTISYTADMLVNHDWLLPKDTFGIPATKPPLYNWISAPFVALFGYEEWALKAPSILASLAVLLGILLFGRRIAAGTIAARPTAALAPETLGPFALGIAAGLMWLASFTTSRLIYLARPDMLLTALLCGAWYSATVLVDDPVPRRGTALVYWLCTIGAAFDKGPMVLLALLYLPLAAGLLHGRWRRTFTRSGWWWGVPLMLAATGLWAALAYREHPEFFRQIFLGREITGRTAGLRQFFVTIFHGPWYMIAYLLPWSLGALAMFFVVPVRRWFKHPLAPAFLWVLMIVVIYSFASSKRPDRYAPVFPAMALMAAHFLLYAINGVRVKFRLIATAALVIISGLGAYYLFMDASAKTLYGDHVTQFASAVSKLTSNDTILFLDGQQTPLETLLGAQQPEPPTPQTQRDAQWCVRYFDPGSAAVLVSQPIAQVDGWHAARLGLYRLRPGEGVEQFEKSLLVPIGVADEEDNPASAPGFYPPEVTRWHQLWRFHTLPAAPQKAGGPAQR